MRSQYFAHLALAAALALGGCTNSDAPPSDANASAAVSDTRSLDAARAALNVRQDVGAPIVDEARPARELAVRAIEANNELPVAERNARKAARRQAENAVLVEMNRFEEERRRKRRGDEDIEIDAGESE